MKDLFYIQLGYTNGCGSATEIHIVEGIPLCDQLRADSEFTYVRVGRVTESLLDEWHDAEQSANVIDQFMVYNTNLLR